MDMGVKSMRARKRGRGGFVAALIVSAAVFATACASPGAVNVDADDLPGTYRDGKTGGEILLDVNGRFSAKGISKSDAMGRGGTVPVDFGGTWSATPSNFVYLEPDDGGGRDMEDIQLWTASAGKVFLHPDVDGPITLKLIRVTNP
ncbi:hypothetical protein [Streptomyces sp. NBC_01276]|uniref:hypothetical protein n=1 Tax=Streptomyces sp. NBC_01276 TaxID=2903808 RepID=UPI00352D502D